MSREKKYTEGPWEAYDDQSGRACVRSTVERQWPKTSNPTGKAITGWGCVTQTVANANLISAAPDLLEALENCQRELNAHITARNMTAEVDDLHDYQTVHEAAIAIAKAYGGHHE